MNERIWYIHYSESGRCELGPKSEIADQILFYRAIASHKPYTHCIEINGPRELATRVYAIILYCMGIRHMPVVGNLWSAAHNLYIDGTVKEVSPFF